MQVTLSLMFPRVDKFLVHKAEMYSTQVSTNDCGLFALSYVKSLCTSIEPSLIKLDQSTMRIEFNKFIDRDMRDFSVNVIEDISQTHYSQMIG